MYERFINKNIYFSKTFYILIDCLKISKNKIDFYIPWHLNATNFMKVAPLRIP